MVPRLPEEEVTIFLIESKRTSEARGTIRALWLVVGKDACYAIQFHALCFAVTSCNALLIVEEKKLEKVASFLKGRSTRKP